MKPQYYVYALNYGAPTVRHATLAEAQAEAERLAEKHPGRTFEILKCIGYSSTSKASTFWMDGEGPPHPLGANAAGLVRDEAEETPEKPRYRELEFGEEYRNGDEWLSPITGGWVVIKSPMAGDTVSGKYQARRPL